MRYLITGNFKPFFTDLFEPENHFADGMTVYDLYGHIYTTDGKKWQSISIDTL